MSTIPSSTEVNCCANPPTEVSGLPSRTLTVLPRVQNLMCFANEGSSISYPAVEMTTPEILYFTYNGFNGLRIGIRGKDLWDVRGHLWQWTDEGLVCSFVGPDGSLTRSEFRFVPSEVIKTSMSFHPDEFHLYRTPDDNSLERILDLKQDIRACNEEAIFYTKKAISCMEEVVAYEKQLTVCEEILAYRRSFKDDLYLRRVWEETIY